MPTLTESIVERLVSHLATAFDPPLPEAEHPRVEEFPDNVERYVFKAARTTLLVGYERSTYGAPESLHPISQPRRRELGVTILARSLRKPEGVVEMIAHIQRALLGWRPPQGGTAITLVRDEFVGEDQGTWRFVVIFETTAPVVAVTTPLTGPPLKTVTLRNHTDPRPVPPDEP